MLKNTLWLKLDEEKNDTKKKELDIIIKKLENDIDSL